MSPGAGRQSVFGGLHLLLNLPGVAVAGRELSFEQSTHRGVSDFPGRAIRGGPAQTLHHSSWNCSSGHGGKEPGVVMFQERPPHSHEKWASPWRCTGIHSSVPLQGAQAGANTSERFLSCPICCHFIRITSLMEI